MTRTTMTTTTTGGAAGMRGNALAIGILVVALFTASTATMLSLGLARSRGASSRASLERANRAVEGALSIKLAKFLRFDDKGIVGTFADGTRYCVVVRVHPQGDLFKVTAAAVSPDSGDFHISEIVVERLIAAAQSNFHGALMAKQGIDLGGTSRVIGNNHDIYGNPIGLGFGATPLHDKVAVASMGTIRLTSGAARLAGGGDTTLRNQLRPGNDGRFDVVDANQNAYPNAQFGTTAQRHFPTTADQALASPDGTAKSRAQQLGTYFTSLAAFDAWAASLPNANVPPNSLLYLDFQVPSPGMDLGSNLNWGTTYHTVIQHHPITAEALRPRLGAAGATMTAYVDQNRDGQPDAFGTLDEDDVTGRPVWDGYGYVKTEPDGDSVVKALHGVFCGVLICDNLSNMNAGAAVFGGVCSLQEDDGTNQNFCSGKAEVTYSAAAIDRAIAVNMFTGTSYKIREYRERPMTRDAQLAASRVGVTLAISAFPEDAVSSTDSTRTVDGWLEPCAPIVAASAVP